MTFLDTVKSGITTAVDAVSGVTQTIIEKNRANAQLNRLKVVMKNECETINRAYIALGKTYYENKVRGKNDVCPNEEELFDIIRQSKANIERARESYRIVLESQQPEFLSDEELEEIESIEIFDDEETLEKQEKEPEEVVEDVIEKVKKKAEELADEAEAEAETPAEPIDEATDETDEVAETEELF